VLVIVVVPNEMLLDAGKFPPIAWKLAFISLALIVVPDVKVYGTEKLLLDAITTTDMKVTNNIAIKIPIAVFLFSFFIFNISIYNI